MIPITIKQNKYTSIENVNKQLEQINELKQNPAKLDDIFNTARQHTSKEGQKVTRAKEGSKSKIMDVDGNEIVIKDLSDSEFSVLNFEDGQPYLLLHGTLFYNDASKDNTTIDSLATERGIRKGKLAINEASEIFLIKIVEHYVAYSEAYCANEANPEMNIEHLHAGAPQSTVVTRSILREDDLISIKTYSLFRYRGFSSYDVVYENKLSPLQILDLAVQYMLIVYDLQALGIVHRDLKPENYTVEKNANSSLKVSAIDYGYAKKMLKKEPSKTHEDGYAFFQGKETTNNCGSLGYLPLILEKNPRKAWIYDFSTEMYAASISAIHILDYYTTENGVDSFSLQESKQFNALKKLIKQIVNNIQYEGESSSLPQLNQYLIRQQLNFIKEAINKQFYPVKSYSTFSAPEIIIPPVTLPALASKNTPVPRKTARTRIVLSTHSSSSEFLSKNRLATINELPDSCRRTPSPLSRTATPELTPISEIDSNDELIEIKNAFNEAIKNYKRTPQSFFRKTMCFLPEKHMAYNMHTANSLLNDINKAKDIEEISIAVKKCFSENSREANRGVNQYSLISFILEKEVICKGLNIQIDSLLERPKQGFWHSPQAANDRIHAKKYFAELSVETYDDVARNLFQDQGVYN